MKQTSPSSPASGAPLSGKLYWKSLDELAATPEFNQWVEREFPEGASEFTDPVSRRHFVKIMSASFVLAGMGLAGSGCRRPVEKLEPFGKMPENYIHGIPQFYATAMATPSGALPLVAKSNDGRPTKVEGNDQHPDSNGGTDRFAQASILNLYDPDRARRFAKGGFDCTPEAAVDFLSGVSRAAQANEGQGLSFLLERTSSPSRRRLQTLVSNTLPKARWYLYDPVDLDIQRRAASQAFGKSVKPYYLFDKANVVVSLDCDFLGSEEDVQNHIRRFAQRRHIEKPEDSLNRLYVVEGQMTVTGFNADHRLRLPTSLVAQAAGALAAEVLPERGASAGVEGLGKPAGNAAKWVAECAKDLLANRGQCLVVAGYRQPLAVHLLAHALNAALGNVGKTVVFHEVPESKEGTITELAQALNAGQVETLVILGSNPAYTAPAELDWAKAQAKAKTVVRLGYYEDETSVGCHLHLPAAHFLEAWGDARTSDGTLVPVQPLIAPLFGGLTELEVLARIGGSKVTDPYAIVRETFASLTQGGNFEETWKKFLHDGFLAKSAAQPTEVKLSDSAIGLAVSALKLSPPSKDKLEVVFLRDYKVDDGRYNNNGWLQELPDPVTKVVWDNVVLISRKTAQDLGVKNYDVVEIQLGGRKVKGPIWVQPGQADDSLGVALGYGREKVGRVGQGTGFNAYLIRTAQTANFTVGATVSKTGNTYPLSCTQAHWSMEGRPIIREVDHKQYKATPNFAKAMEEAETPEVSMYPNPFDQLKQKGLHQWGMSIDLNKCVGCSACMVACQSENNVPIVGKDQVNRGREMHWIRIDRYYTGRPLVPAGSAQAKEQFFQTHERDNLQQFQSWIDDPQAVTQPMLCQHCEAAPCENVCPVNATSHDQEGLNVMTYNRCVGTRYCSNNCPYKVRRFNFFDFNKRPIDNHKLYLGPLAKRPDDEWDLLKMSKNPDVTVRMRGVMEKCTFCLQRIEQAKIAQKRKAGASGDVVVPSDSFTTACAQACPAGAIVFGNLKDPESRVSKLKRLERDYSVLQILYTRPRTTYLARVRNPNEAMPDYSPEGPMSLQEYEQKMGKLSEHTGEGEGAGEPVTKGAH